jgi:hypothetical protein
MLVPVGAMWHRPGADRDDVALTRLWCERHRRLWVTDEAAGAVMNPCDPLPAARWPSCGSDGQRVQGTSRWCAKRVRAIGWLT